MRRLTRAALVACACVVATACGARSRTTARAVATPTVDAQRADAADRQPDRHDLPLRRRRRRAGAAATTTGCSFTSLDDRRRADVDRRPRAADADAVSGSRARRSSYTRTMFIPEFPYVGETRVEVGLFSPAIGRSPAAGGAGPRHALVPGGHLRRAARATTCSWSSATAGTRPESGRRPRAWSGSGRRRRATLSFRNPKRDDHLISPGRSAGGAPSGAASGRGAVGPRASWTASTVAGRASRRCVKVPLTAEQLGAADTVE